jgi:hypothetical protein
MKLSYKSRICYFNELKRSGTQFLAMTRLLLDEFEILLPYFEKAYQEIYPTNLNWQGTYRIRRARAGGKGRLPTLRDRLYFILI